MPAKKRKAPAAAVGADGQPALDSGKRQKKEKVVGLYEKYKGKKIPEPKIKRCAAVTGALKAICWNVAGLRALLAKRTNLLQKLIKQEQPAILGFLETKLQDGEQVDEVTELLKKALPKYKAHFSCSTQKKGYSGVAVLVHEGFADAEVTAVKLEQGPSEGRTLCVEMKRVFVVICYVMNSGDNLQRLRERLDSWDPALKEHLLELAKKKPVLLLGDLSVAHRDRDIWNLEAAHIPKMPAATAEERASFGQLLETGFVDAFAHLHPEAMGAFTYWSVRAGNRQPNRGLRLDYAVVSASMLENKHPNVKLADAFHLPAYAPGGDHCPVGATLSGAV